MKTTLRIATLVAILQANSVFAANGADSAGISLGGWIFIGFMAVIVIFQFVPALFMFGSMMAALFGKSRSHKGVTENGKANHV